MRNHFEIPTRNRLDHMRVNNLRPGEKLNCFQSKRAAKIASRIIARGNARRAVMGSCVTPWEIRYPHICRLAGHKYPFRDAIPDWVYAGSLD